MRQHAIDLLPDPIRARSQAGMRLGQYVASLVTAVLVVVVLTTHAQLRLQSSREALSRAEADANLVLDAEAKASELQERLKDLEAFVERYERVALPVEISHVLATLVNQLPESVALDRIDLDAQIRRGGKSPRSKGGDQPDAHPPRVLNGELAGFAATDQDIAELVARLEGTAPFSDVSLVFSRSRPVREQGARDFRISFKIDLDCRYLQTGPITAAAPAPRSAMPAGTSAGGSPAPGPRAASRSGSFVKEAQTHGNK